MHGSVLRIDDHTPACFSEVSVEGAWGQATPFLNEPYKRDNATCERAQTKILRVKQRGKSTCEATQKIDA